MSDCDDIKFYSPKDTYGGEVPQERCYSVEQKVPQELREPTDVVELKLSYIPDPILIGNDHIEVYCPEGTLQGEQKGVIINKNKFTEEFLLQSVYSIPQEVIVYITKNKLEPSIQDYLNNTGFLDEDNLNENLIKQFTNLTKIPREIVLQIITQVNIIKQKLNKAAELESQVELDCYYVNDYIEAVCPGEIVQDLSPERLEEVLEELKEYAVQGNAVNRVNIASGTFKSYLSKDDANNLAKQAALIQLLCFFDNDPVHVTCLDQDRPGRPDEWKDIPTDQLEEVKTYTDKDWYQWLLSTNNQFNSVDRPIGEADVQRGVFTSTESKAAANQMALEYAYTLLNCIYLNDYQEVSCEDERARFLNVSPRTNPPFKAEVPSTGQIVYALAGYQTSTINTQQANEIVIETIQSLLECCFVNAPISEVCEEYIEVDSTGNPTGKRIKASYIEDPSQSIQVYIPEGMFTSCESQEEADNLAREYADSLLEQCYYCNETVLPACVPPWVITAVQTGVYVQQEFTDDAGVTYGPGSDQNNLYILPLPLDYKNIFNPFTGQREDVSKWSVDATTGYPAHSMCVRRQEVMILDDLVVSVTPTIDTEREACHYENDPVVAGCRVRDPYLYLGDSYTHIFISKFPPYEEDDPSTHPWCITDHLSNPQTDGYIEIPAGTFRASEYDLPRTERTRLDENGAEERYLYPILPGEKDYQYGANIDLVKAYVNQQAIDMAESMLECVFSNPLTIATCTAREEDELCGDLWRFNDPTFKVIGGRKLHESSHTEDNPIIIPEDTFTSYTSKQEVLEQTKAFAQSMLLCQYGNLKQKCDCDDLGRPYTTNSIITIPENTFFGSNPEELDQQAKELACSLVVCIKVKNGARGPQGPQGPPGAAGAPGKDGTPGGCAGTCHGIYC